MAVIIREIGTKKELKKFIRFGINLYKNCEFAAPPLLMDDLLNLSKGSNPALDFCETAYFLAYKENKIVGRIAAIINPVANERWNQKNARFGWVDFIDDAEVTTALFEAAEKWAKSKGMIAIQGPLGFADFDHEGTLIEGYNKLGTLATIYNYPYYPEHIERNGYVKDIDWNEYLITVPEVFPEKYFRIAEIVKEKFNLTPKHFKSRKEVVNNYAQKIFELLNLCYQDLYGYTKLNDKQIHFYIKLYFSFFRLDTISIVVDKKDDVIALGIAMPSFTKALQKAKGRLFPLGWCYMLRALKKNDLVDLYLMAVHPDYQNKGVNSILFAELMPQFAKNGYKFAESNPELETNTRMSSQWGNFEYVNHKKRRVYIKEI
ncbi:MAG: GNAT family N-acetyltransferase [Bacteroidales bacterium]|nr:GNAT family N-acetyltransferase [Bacteroidales bacterium]